MTHTPGKVEIGHKNKYELWHGEYLVASTVPKQCGEYPEDAPNARRLAAAWNACIGVSTESLERGLVADALKLCEGYLDPETYREATRCQ